MKARIARKPFCAILRRTRRALLAAGFSLCAYSGFVFLDAQYFQHRQNLVLDRLLLKPLPSPVVPVSVPPLGLIGRIEIPRLGLSQIVMEGSDSKTLRRAVGHVPGTALPGESGNSAITAHRDTFFRPLRKIRSGDLISVTTLTGQYNYRVQSTEIVNPDNTEVLDPSSSETLTLITCYPFYFVGSAPHRFIVHAERIAAPYPAAILPNHREF